MSSYFCLSITLLDSAFHGCGDGGEPEWPPSPLRAFQTLVAAAAAREPDSRFASDAAPAFEWLESLEPPDILTPIGRLASDDFDLTVGTGEAGPVTTLVRQQLTDIQYGRAEDRYGWLHRIA